MKIKREKYIIIFRDYLNFMNYIAYSFHYFRNIENIFMIGVKQALYMVLRQIASGEADGVGFGDCDSASGVEDDAEIWNFGKAYIQ